MVKGLGDWEQRLNTALVKSTPGGIVRAEPRTTSEAEAPEPPAPAAGGTRTKATRDL
jgi:hypothetical protein